MVLENKSFRSDYEGWKHGNVSIIELRYHSHSFRSDYEGWKHIIKLNKLGNQLYTVLEVTMRDGNSSNP